MPRRWRIGRQTQQARSRPQELDRPPSTVTELHNQVLKEFVVQFVTMHKNVSTS
jgi:hypothetical protein